MSLQRLNYLLLRNVLPFNFGMTHDHWIKLWDDFPKLRGILVSQEDPRTWSPERIAQVNNHAQEQNQLYEHLMSLSDEEFCKQVDQLRKEQSASDESGYCEECGGEIPNECDGHCE